MSRTSVEALVSKVKEHMAIGLYDPETLFNVIYNKYDRYHYSKLRSAIHIAKTR